MAVNPFEALGIEAPAAPPPPSSGMIPGQDMPTMRITPSKGGVNPFSALGIDTSVEYPATPSRQAAPAGQGIGANFAAGANQSIFGALGAPADLASGAMHLLERGRAATSGIPSPWAATAQEPVGGSSWIKRQFGRISTNPDDVQPATEGERMAQAAGGAVAQVPLMAMGGAAASGLPGVAGGVARTMARAGVETVPQAALTAAATGVGGAAGQLAEDKSPEALKPYANIAGNLAGAAGTIGAVAGARAGTNLVVRKAGEAGLGRKTDIAGMRATGSQIDAAGGQVDSALGPEGRQIVERVASAEQEARGLEATIGDPAKTPDEIAAAQSRLRQIQSQRMNLVPGSEPTLSQVAPTPGAVTLEKTHRVAEPAPFLQRAQDQNVARVGAINSVQPEGSPASVGQMFTDHLNALEAEGQQRIGAASGAVTGATERLGGQQSLAALGEAMRGGLEANNAMAQAREKKLWQAVDPEGTLALSIAPVRDAAKKLIGEVNPAVGDVLTAQEAAFLPAVANAPEVVSFSDLSALRSNIGAAQRELGPRLGFDSRPLRRLGILKNAVDESIARAVDEHVSRDPDLAGRVKSEIQQYGEVTGRGPGGAHPADRGGVASGLPGSSGAPGAGNAGRGNATGSGAIPPFAANGGVAIAEALVDQGVSAPPRLTPNFDQAAADRYGAARQSTLERKSTYRSGPVGQALRPGPGGADFAVADSDVARKFFSGGAREPEDVAKFIAAAGGQKEALDAARNYLASDMRARGIIHPDGTLDQAKFAGWQRTHNRTVDLFPGLREHLQDATAAQRTLDDVTAAHDAAVKAFQDGVAKNFLHDDPLVAVRKAFSSGNPTQTFTDLARAVRGNADAEAGLRRGVVDFILQRMSSTAPSGAGDVDFLNAATFQKWVRQNKGPLRALFGGQGSQNIEMVAADLRRMAQRTAATGGSDTAANLAAGKKHGVGAAAAHQVPMTVLTLIGEHLGAAAHGGLGGLVGAVVLPALGSLGHSMRQAGIDKVNGLVREAMLHPDLARELMQRTADRRRLSLVTQRRIGSALQAAMIADMAHSSQRTPPQ